MTLWYERLFAPLTCLVLVYGKKNSQDEQYNEYQLGTKCIFTGEHSNRDIVG